MGQVFKIERDSPNLDKLIQVLKKNKNDIKELICIIRACNGDMNIIDTGASYETMCSGNKLLDFKIITHLLGDSLELEIEQGDYEDEEE